MSETQIYKWWWDQTRKRLKKLKKATSSKLFAVDCKSMEGPSAKSGGDYETSTDKMKRRRNSKGAFDNEDFTS